MLNKYLSLRWILLGTAIVAILGLTAMNVFSLYKLHETTIESDLENKKLQISEFTDKIRHRFYASYRGLGKLEMDHIQRYYQENGQFPAEFLSLLDTAAADSIFSGIYFKERDSKACQENDPLLKYLPDKHTFTPVLDYPESVCDGLGIARTRMKVLIEEYRFNNKIIFDTNASMSIALINLTTHEIFGYLTMLINQDYLVNEYLQDELVDKFGDPEKSGVVAWVRDWTRDQTVACSNPTHPFNENKVQYKQRFPDFFDNWTLKVAFTESPTVAASKASLIKNFVVLGVAVVILLGALVFIFVTAQKERALAQRQAGFLANVTHELKTPLAVMQAAGENLADGRVDNKERLQSYGRHIHREALRLKQMIEKLLDVAKTDAGQALIEPRPVQLDHLLRVYIEDHRPYIDDKGFELETNIEDALPPVMIDEDSFGTIIGNLIENATKYSQENKYIGINLYQVGDVLRLEVIDHGVGIPTNSLKHIFEKFYRVEDSLTAKSKGHGLGLSIVKNLVTLNGGKIEVDSEEGKGSTFILEFPVRKDLEPDSMLSKQKLSSPNKTVEDSPQYAG